MIVCGLGQRSSAELLFLVSPHVGSVDHYAVTEPF